MISKRIFLVLCCASLSSACRTTTGADDEAQIKSTDAPLSLDASEFEPTPEASLLEGLVPQEIGVDLDVVRKLGDGLKTDYDRYPIELKIWKRIPQLATTPPADLRDRVIKAFSLGYIGEEPDTPPTETLEALFRQDLSPHYIAGDIDALMAERGELKRQLDAEEVTTDAYETKSSELAMQVLLNQVVAELTDRFETSISASVLAYPMNSAEKTYKDDDECRDRYDCAKVRKPAYVVVSNEYVALLVVLQKNR